MTLVRQQPQQGATDEWLTAAAHNVVRTQSAKCFSHLALTAKHTCPSNSLQALTPMHNPIKDILKQLQLTSEEKPKILSKAFEDDQAACHPASNQQLLVRTKHFAVKCQFFWQFVCHAEKNPEGWLNVEKCSNDLMNADCLTKRLAKIELAPQHWSTSAVHLAQDQLETSLFSVQKRKDEQWKHH